VIGDVGRLAIEGRVDGNVDATVRQLHVTDGATIRGAINYRSHGSATIDEGAVVAGPVTRGDPPNLLPFGGPLAWGAGALPRLAALIAAGAVVLLLLPRPAVAVADGGRSRPLDALLTGLGLAVFVPIAVLLLSITIIALPVALIISAGYVGGLYLSQVFVGLAVGRLLLRLPAGQAGRGINLVAMAIGVTLLAALRLAPLPHANTVFAVFVALFGLGAVAVGLGSEPASAARTAQLAGVTTPGRSFDET
jgi:hypothetical protein